MVQAHSHPGERAADLGRIDLQGPFHDEIGFLLWDKKNEQVLRTVVFGRGIAIQAGATAKARDKMIHFKAMPGDRSYGILQYMYVMERAQLMSFTSVF